MKLFYGLMLAAIMFVGSSFSNEAMAQPKSVAEFTIENESDWTIEYIYFSSVYDDYWGDDKLGSYVLEPGYEYEMKLTSGCGDYDIRLVDEDSDECVVMGVYLCNDKWVITTDDLLDCIYGDDYYYYDY